MCAWNVIYRIMFYQDQESYICKKCRKRKDNDYYLNNNLHPVWFEVNEDGSHKLDEAGEKIPHFEIPQELQKLTVAERLLIQRCATFVPSVQLSNGTFALKGNCVTFPQDITQMCNELPHRKEQVLVFMHYIGNKDTSAVYPKIYASQPTKCYQCTPLVEETQSTLLKCNHQ
jgi:hypothetical protein